MIELNRNFRIPDHPCTTPFPDATAFTNTNAIDLTRIPRSISPLVLAGPHSIRVQS
jgi:hypothetical protein